MYDREQPGHALSIKQELAALADTIKMHNDVDALELCVCTSVRLYRTLSSVFVGLCWAAAKIATLLDKW